MLTTIVITSFDVWRQVLLIGGRLPVSKLYHMNTSNCSTRMQTLSWEVPTKYKGGPKFAVKGHKIIGSIKAIAMVNRTIVHFIKTKCFQNIIACQCKAFFWPKRGIQTCPLWNVMQFIHRLVYILGYSVTLRFKGRQNKEQTVCLI